MTPIFQFFCINWFGIGPLRNLASLSKFGFEFAEIFEIENRRLVSVSRGVGQMILSNPFFKPLNKLIEIVPLHPWIILCEIGLLMAWFSLFKFRKLTLMRGVDDSPYNDGPSRKNRSHCHVSLRLGGFGSRRNRIRLI
jgi:hypothetical protein